MTHSQEEALAVKKDFRDNGTILRVYQQATRDGKDTGPLKKRKRGEYRDIPAAAGAIAVLDEEYAEWSKPEKDK